MSERAARFQEFRAEFRELLYGWAWIPPVDFQLLYIESERAIKMKIIPLITACGFSMLAPFMPATANAHGVIIENWKPCATGFQRKDGEPSWLEVPAWARAASLRPWYYGEPRMLANHGLCNAKFHRVVLCLPGWQESDDQNAGWFKVCRDWQALQDWKRNNK